MESSWDFPGGSVGEESARDAGDKGEMGLVNIQEVLPLWSSKFILATNFVFVFFFF